MANIQERVIARLRRNEDGSLSNSRIEQYALMRSEAVVTPGACWTVVMGKASGSYQANIHKSPAFKARLEELVVEREQLQEQGPWGQLEWMTRQNYRRAVAVNDVRGMTAATEMLYRILTKNEKAAPKPAAGDAPEGEEATQSKGRGAPTAPTPQPEDGQADYFADRLIGR